MKTSLSMAEKAGTSANAASPAQADASRYRWVVLAVVWAAFLLSYVDRVAWSSVAAPVGQSLGLAVSMLGAFITAFYIGYVLANIAGGILTDVLGGRATLTLALVPLGMLTFCFGFAHTLWTGIAIQFAMGLAAGADYSAGMKIIAAWFRKDRGRAMGLYTTATSLAIVLTNATVPTISQWYGWQSAFRLLGVITLACAALAWFVLRDAPEGEPPMSRIKAADVVVLLKHRNLILLAIAGCGGLWATVGFGAWANALMTRQYGITPVTAGSIAATFGIGAVIAKPVLGWLSDLHSNARKRISILCLSAFAVMLMVFGQSSTITQFYLIAPLLGAVGFGYTPVLMAQVSDASGRNSAGAAAGLTNAIWQSGSAMSPLVVGYFYGQTHSFSVALLTLAVGPVIAVAALMFLSRRS
ncbi:MFS transporter [Cupriavidus sp. WKF15]|uniref:MFS transporter n=1 Tax=Cupriavidus sp. WKF15 TaxID=3032282 RepID=UPI0023E12A4C|nr:MFS transporter [Cupriavidus sp. WKF15]WER50080.1 MFS transporter [Cupriavidus sp. WKF15]